MKMKKQNIYKPYFTIMGNTSLWNRDKGNGGVKAENEEVKHTASWQGIIDFTSKAIRTLCQMLQGSIVKLLSTDGNGRQVLVDLMSTEGFFFPRYTLLGTPQVLYMLPVNAYKKKAALLPFRVSVKPLEENCYELVIESNKEIEGSKTSKEELSIHIYDESNSLVFSEQITYNGYFTRLYDLQWPLLRHVAFEVRSRFGVCRTAIQ